jgi:hypothetical protein
MSFLETDTVIYNNEGTLRDNPLIGIVGNDKTDGTKRNP